MAAHGLGHGADGGLLAVEADDEAAFKYVGAREPAGDGKVAVTADD